jgi:hypothetical protein
MDAVLPLVAPAYPLGYRGLPEPLRLPWALKPLGSAQYGVDHLDDGRTRFWIRHDIVQGVTPRMLAWWFCHLEGEVEIDGQRFDRYRVWHPYDHIGVRYARRQPDGRVGPGAVLHIREVIGRDPRFAVDVLSEIEKIDEEGFVHNPVFHGIRGLARMEYRFTPVGLGTFYENCLIFGSSSPWFRLLRPLIAAWAFPQGKGEAWWRHNIEEVGMLEHFLPALYEREVGSGQT